MDDKTLIRTMVTQHYKSNAQHIEQDLQWLEKVIAHRYKMHHQKERPVKVPSPPVLRGNSIYKRVIQNFKMSPAERLVLILSLVPHIAPHFLEDVWRHINQTEPAQTVLSKPAPEPQVDLALFLLAGDDLEHRFYFQQIFDADSLMFTSGMMLAHESAEQSILHHPIRISPEYLHLLTHGRQYRPPFSSSFPAKRITTSRSWDDLVLNAQTLEQVLEIKSWIAHSQTILGEWGLGDRLAPGYKILFYGLPGTGKSFTAALLGQDTGTDVYRIDLSLVVSKYIGETEKNLSRIFDQANNKNWILFFDEADALFGKRTELRDAHDRYANQEVAFLLQKIEDHNGVVILSSNMRANIDEAFTRRFQNAIYFPMPSPEQRLRLWQNGFSSKTALQKEISLDHLSEKYELSGGAIMNVVRYASLKAVESKRNTIQLRDMVNGIAREFSKEGRTI